ncbi:MAG: PIN domain-containing protein [Bacteroidetes bacterium]|nr:PIN domain-containing protein [Bacteroidota bacterium]
MSGIDILVDTNVLINLSEGKKRLNDYLQGIFVSAITEIELLGWYKISEREKKFFLSLLSDCLVVELLAEVKSLAILLKQKNKLKLPDAIIATSSLYLEMPLLTFDSDFQKIHNLNLILLDN